MRFLVCHRDQVRDQHLGRAVCNRVVRRDCPAAAAHARHPRRALPQACARRRADEAGEAKHRAVAAARAADRDQRHIIRVHLLVLWQLQEARERAGRDALLARADELLLVGVKRGRAAHLCVPVELGVCLAVGHVLRREPAQMREVVPAPAPALQPRDLVEPHRRRQVQRELRRRDDEWKAALVQRDLGLLLRRVTAVARRLAPLSHARHAREYRLHRARRVDAALVLPRPVAVRVQTRRHGTRRKQRHERAYQVALDEQVARRRAHSGQQCHGRSTSVTCIKCPRPPGATGGPRRRYLHVRLSAHPRSAHGGAHAPRGR